MHIQACRTLLFTLEFVTWLTVAFLIDPLHSSNEMLRPHRDVKSKIEGNKSFYMLICSNMTLCILPGKLSEQKYVIS